MKKRRFLATVISIMTAASVFAGCVSVTTISDGYGSTEQDTNISVSSEVSSPETGESEATNVSIKNEDNSYVFEGSISPIAVEKPGTEECNHRYGVGASYWDSPYAACLKCGYSPAIQTDHDCKTHGHIYIIDFGFCSVCGEYNDYIYYADYDSLKIIDYKDPTDECDGVVQAATKDGDYLLIAFIPAGHNHSTGEVTTLNDFATYQSQSVSDDICMEGIIRRKVCSICNEPVTEDYMITPANGYHTIVKVLREADSEDPNSLALIQCEYCEKKYEVSLPKKIQLSGNKKDIITTTEYGYIDGEDYLILLDKDIKLPGDFEVIISDSIKEIRKQTGLLSDNWSDEQSYFNQMANYIGANYWEALPGKNRIILNMVVDREAYGYISCAIPSSAIFVEYEFFGDDVWNSVPDYSDNPWRRDDEPDYGTFFHELTHAITLRTTDSWKMGRIISEGIAEYIAIKVDETFINENRKGYTPSYDVTYDQTDFHVTAENAEELFRNDYYDLSHADRGAEYDYGKYFFEFLDKNYGSDYYLRVCNALNKVNWSSSAELGTATEDDRNNRTEAIKKEFGDDVFVKFGKWYQNK